MNWNVVDDTDLLTFVTASNSNLRVEAVYYLKILKQLSTDKDLLANVTQCLDDSEAATMTSVPEVSANASILLDATTSTCTSAHTCCLYVARPLVAIYSDLVVDVHP